MSEKRYELDVRLNMPKLLIDKNTNEKYNLLMVNDIERIVDLLNEADNRIESLEKRSKQLFLMEKVIDRMLSKEEQIGFYNMVELEMIRDE